MIWVQGIVSHRDKRPYVQIADETRMIAQLTIAEARSIALDLLRAASYAETDGMLHRFFSKMEFPDEALAALLTEFRDFRHNLDTEPVKRVATDPDTGEEG